jgi:hypothetical protein
MSHFTQINTEIRDFDALRTAVVRCGGELVENAECRWYSGTRQFQLVVRLPGRYDAALERQSDESYRLTADWYGGHVARYLGRNGDILLQLYAAEKAKLEGRRRGFSVTERQEGDAVLITLRDPAGGALKVWCYPGGRTVCQPDGIRGESCMKFFDIEKALGAVEEHRRTGDYYTKDDPQVVQLGHFLCG